ncbi:MAG: vWA domain-containing protein [Myxococcota bacterium]
MGTSAPPSGMAADAAYEGGAGDGAAMGSAAFSAADMEEAAPEPAMAKVAEAESTAMADDDDEEAGFARGAQAGLLTAGTFDDTLNPATFASFMQSMAGNDATASVAQFLGGPISTVTVVDGSGRPVADSLVTVRADGTSRVVRTGTDGRAIIVSGYDHPRGAQLQVGVDGQSWVSLGEGSARRIATQRRAAAIRAMDVAIVIDATGSMGDELEYLKVELRSIAKEIKREFPNVDQRFALVAYRDQGDQYVTRKFDFTANMAEFQRTLGRQRADGGGDYPEAMDAALEDANQLSWRNAPGTARVAFVVADAPPHAQDMVGTMTAVESLRQKGVAIYPVAASGVAAEAEMIMRAAAATTGAQYIFLTDDSGVGNGHAEPHIPCYAVQHLRSAMSRMLTTELSGRRIEADPRRTIRSVGKNNAGVCAPLRIAQ